MAFGKDLCGIRVDDGDKGRCREIGGEATVRVQARGDGGLAGRMDAVGWGDVDVE